METACPVSHCVFSPSFRRFFSGVYTPCCSTTRMAFFFHFSVGRPIRTFFCFVFFPPNICIFIARLCVFSFSTSENIMFFSSSIPVLLSGIYIPRTCPGLHLSLLLQTQQVLHMAEVCVFHFSDFTIYSGEEEGNAEFL